MNEIGIYRQDRQAYQSASYFDTVELKNNLKQPILLSDGEKIIFGVKAHYTGDYIIKKVLTSADEIGGKYPIYLTPEEMDIMPGRYYYNIGVQTTGGDFIPIVPKSIFDVFETETRKE